MAQRLSIVAGQRLTLPEPIKLHRQLDFLLAEYETFGDQIALTATSSTDNNLPAAVMTFRQLKDAADSFAACLRQKLSSSPNSTNNFQRQRHPIVVIVTSLENISTVPLLFGILKCGAAYCWLPPPPTAADDDKLGQWQEQFERALRRLRPALIVMEDDNIIQHRLTPAILKAQYQIIPFNLLKQLASNMLDADVCALDEELMHSDLAFSSDHSPAAVLYDLTGESFFIILSHLAISNQLATLWRCLPSANGEVNVWHSPLCSTRHIFELLAPLLFGRPVIIVQGEMQKLSVQTERFLSHVKQHRPRRLFLTALQLNLLLNHVESTAVEISTPPTGRRRRAENFKQNALSYIKLVCVVEQLGKCSPHSASFSNSDQLGEICSYERAFHCNPHLIRRFARTFNNNECKLALLYTARTLNDTLLCWTLLDNERGVSATAADAPLGVPALNSCVCVASGSGLMARRGATGLLWAVNTSLPQLSAQIERQSQSHTPTKTLRGFNSNEDARDNANRVYELVPSHFVCLGALGIQMNTTDSRLILVDADPTQTARVSGDGAGGWLSLPKLEYELREALAGDRDEPLALHSLLLKSSTQCVWVVIMQIDKRLLQIAESKQNSPQVAEKNSKSKKKSQGKKSESVAVNGENEAGNYDNETILRLLYERSIYAALTNVVNLQYAAAKKGKIRPEFSWNVCAITDPFPMTLDGTLNSVELLTMVKRQLILSSQHPFGGASEIRRGSSQLTSPNYYHLHSPEESQRPVNDANGGDIWVLENSSPLATKHEKGIKRWSSKRKANESEESIGRALLMTRQNAQFAVFATRTPNEGDGDVVKLEQSIFDQGIHYGNIIEFLRNAHSLGATLTLTDLTNAATGAQRTIAELAVVSSISSEHFDNGPVAAHSYTVKTFSQLSFVEIDQALTSLAPNIVGRGECDMYADTSVTQYRKLLDKWKRLPEWREQSFVLYEGASESAKMVGVAIGATWATKNAREVPPVHGRKFDDDSGSGQSESDTSEDEEPEESTSHALLDAGQSADHPLLRILLGICDENEQEITSQFFAKIFQALAGGTSTRSMKVSRLLFRMPTVSPEADEADFVRVAVQLEQEAIKLASRNKSDLLIAHCMNSFQQNMTEYQLGYDGHLAEEFALKQALSPHSNRGNVVNLCNDVELADLLRRIPDSCLLVTRGINLTRQAF